MRSKKLNGDVNISGAKNAALTYSNFVIAFRRSIKLKNVPDLYDIKTTEKLLNAIGS